MLRARLAVAAAVATLAVAAMPAAAGAETFYVDDDSPGSALCNQPPPAEGCTTIMQAVGQARLNAEADVIQVAPGLYLEDIRLTDAKDSELEIRGAGSGDDPATSTIVRAGGPAVSGVVVLGAPATGQLQMLVAGLRVENTTHDSGSGPRGSGVLVNARLSTLEDVHVEIPPVAAADPGVSMRAEGGLLDRVTVRVGGEGVGVYSDGDGLTIRDSDIGTGGGSGIRSQADGHLALARTRVEVGAPAGGGLGGYALATEGTLTADSSLLLGGSLGLDYNPGSPPTPALLRGVTVDAGALGVADQPVITEDGTFPLAMRLFAGAQLESSIVLERSEITGDGELRCTFSDVPDQVQSAGGGQGAITCPTGAGNTLGNSTNPVADLFAAPGDYRLRPGSPAIETGSPAPLASGESPTDLAGGPRVLDGDADGEARRDKGAYEAPVGSALAGAPDVLAPVVSRLSLSNRTFRVGRAAGAARRRRVPRGTRFRYRLSEQAAVIITIERRLPGRRVRGKCRRPSRENRGRRRCRRFKRIGRLTQAGVSGPNVRRFSGRIGRRKLRPGRYRATLVATDDAGNASAPKRVSFKVVA